MKKELEIIKKKLERTLEGFKDAYETEGYDLNNEKYYVETALRRVNLLLLHNVSDSDLTDEDNPVFKIAVATSYPVNDIIDFMAFTGIKLKETEVLLKRFSEYGISNIKDVNTLAKTGYFHY